MRAWIWVMAALMAGAAAPVAAEETAAVPFRCGSLELTARFEAEAVDLVMHGGQHRLVQAPAASGARYEGRIAGLPAEFWNKGREASLRVGQAELPTCQQGEAAPTAPAPDTPGASAGTVAGAPPVGPRWRVSNLADSDPAPDGIDIQFLDGKVTGNAGCNRFGGSYLLEGDALRLQGDVYSTRMACPEPQMRLEAKFLGMMRGVLRYSYQQDGTLVLTAEDGRRILARRAEPEG